MLIRKISTKQILILILLTSLFLRMFRLDYPKDFVFDEVYHAFTAQEYLKGNIEAWEWWTTPPPNVAYEWTHPPLAKEIMTISMFLFKSTDSWAWRIPGVLLGVLSVYLIYLIGLKLFNNQVVSLIAAFSFSLDGLNFVQSRIGMNDIYYVTFVLGSLLYFLQKRYFLSSLLFGLAISSKWAAIYLIVIYIILFIYKKIFKKFFYFLFIPPIVYLITYTPFFLLGHNFNQFIQLQQQMWWYHTNLKAAHDYASPFWSWPLNLYPVWYFVEYQKDLVANIFVSGNPAVFLTGIGTIFLTLIDAVKKKSENLLLVTGLFFVFWLPWAISPRIMFLYHFTPSVPFLCLSLGYQINILYKEGRKKTVFFLLFLITLIFLFLYPYLTAIPLPKNLVDLFFITNLTKDPFNY